MVLGAGFLWEVFGPGACFGWLVGAGLSLLMLAGVEWSIKRFIQPESHSARGLIGVLVVKMVGASLILVLSFIAAMKGWLSIVWVLAGFAMPHMVVVLKLAGHKVREFYATGDPPPSKQV